MLALLLAVGCLDPAERKTPPADDDGDGYTTETDCDDDDAAVHPDADELCDGVDGDCDGTPDDDPAEGPTWYPDADGDGFGDGDAGFIACDMPDGAVAVVGDCDDSRADVNPGVIEDDCTDPTDYDCDGSVLWADADGDGTAACVDCDDADADLTVETTWYRDRDGDGFAAGNESVVQCLAPEGYVAVTGDCDDYDAAANPDEIELCDDRDADEDCDGLADDADSDALADTFATFWADTDGDGFGDAAVAIAQCDAPAAYVTNAEDCDDGNAARRPDAVEVCDGETDEDCDLLVDDADDSVTDPSVWYVDADGDGHGGVTTATACVAPSGYVAAGDDCDDATAGVSPSATEVCDAADTDEDCDGAADDDDSAPTGRTTWYRDADADGYGGSRTTSACDEPAGYVADATDCDDDDDDVSPGLVERCDAADVDEDCDGLADDADDAPSGRTTWYVDADGDGLGSATTVSECDAEAGEVATTGDCDDTSAATLGPTTWYADDDGDGYGDAGTPTSACAAPAGYVADATDCDDAAADSHPGGTERCDAANADEDCDGLTDDSDAGAVGKTAGYTDADRDGYGDADSPVVRCDFGSGWSTAGTDCDDGDASSYPAATETCEDDVDQDCDGSDDECPDFAGSYSASSGYDYMLYGSDPWDWVGGAIDAGDYNGDGRGELVVGAEGIDDSDADGGGVAYLVSRPSYGTGGIIGYYSSVHWMNGATSGVFPSAVTYLSDPDMGGYVLLSGPYGDSLFDPLSGGWEVSTDDDLGTYDCDGASTAGDFTGAGSRYYWVCGDTDETTSSGKVTVRYGPSTTIATFTGETTYDYAGVSIAGGGDVDGDGYDDLWISATGDDDAGSGTGAVYLVYGPDSVTVSLASADAKVRGFSTDVDFGDELDVPGDLDGDGHDDVSVTATGYDLTSGGNEGAVFVLTDISSGTYSIGSAYSYVAYGDGSGYFGYDVSWGDLDGDGTRDLVVFEGYSYGLDLFYGPLATSLTSADADATWSTSSGTYAGSYAGVIPDWDDDGDDELYFSNGDYTIGTDYGTGAVWIWSGT